jgi:hypothetical protein
MVLDRCTGDWGPDGGVGGIFGEKRSDQAVLIGATLGDRHDFLLAGLGIGRISGGRSSSDSRHIYPTTIGIAYTVETHPKVVLDLGLTFFGALGPPPARYAAFAITLNPGRFGD